MQPASTGADALSLLDWRDLAQPTPPIHWVCEPMIEAGRLVALYSPPKTGKSLLAQEIACGLASGRPFWGRPEPAQPQVVLYADWENSREDVLSRVRDLGYGPTDLHGLHYASFPRLAPLVADAARTFVAAVQDLGATLVILDTFSRIIDGNEKDAQVIQRSYRDLFMPLKAEGVAVLRLDHTGKDLKAGQRGSSAKNDDVDEVWSLSRHQDTGDLLGLTRTHTRTGHGSDHVALIRQSGPLRHEVIAYEWEREEEDEEEVDLVVAMDELGLPQDVGRPRAGKALREAGFSFSTSELEEAVRRRKQREAPD